MSDLKLLQRRLAEKLASIYRPPSTVHGFVRGRGIVTNAGKHTGKRFVLNIDLKDFFPTIHFGRVFGLFLSPHIGVRRKAAVVLARICCHQGVLPAGAPTSPTLSNMICLKMDLKLQRLARETGCTYTRYADDITFSAQGKELPKDLAHVDEDGAVVLGQPLRKAIELEGGFHIHPGKVRLIRRPRQQSVTGLVVNSRVNVPRRFVRQLRAMLHAWEKFTLTGAEREFRMKYHSEPPGRTRPPSFAEVVRGKMEFLRQVRCNESKVYRRLQTKLVKVLPSYHAVIERGNRRMKHRDFFVCHASEDKRHPVKPLVDALIDGGASVWYDEYEITVGDSIRRKIDEGLKYSQFGVVVFSPSFFLMTKTWPQRELDGLVAGEDDTKEMRILPVWHDVDRMTVYSNVPTLTALKALLTKDLSVPRIAEQLLAKLRQQL